MSTPEEALAPPVPIDAPVTTPEALPDGEDKGADAAGSSPVAKVEGESPEPAVKGVQKRIDELTKNWRETERREREAARDAAYWREQALRQQQQPVPVKSEPPQGDKTLADFNFDESKYREYERSLITRSAVEEARRVLEAENVQKQKFERDATYARRARDFAKDNPEYKEYAETAPISADVAEIIKGIPNGPEVALHLGKNPDIAIEVSRLPQVQAAFELGQIAAQLKVTRENALKAKTLVSTAPAPAPKIDGTEPAIAIKASSPESDKLSMDEWAKAREKELKRKRNK
jgi:hypothetical protein